MEGVHKWGILDFVPILEQADATKALRQSVLLAQQAEEWGYNRYWVTEHHDMPRLASTNTEVVLAYIGAHTHRIRIGSGALLLPYYKPLKAVEAFHLLASMYPNRVDFGIGRAPGGNAHVSMSLSDTYLEQVRRMPELLDDVTSLLAGNYRKEGEHVAARPTPQVPPQVWLLGTNTKSAQYAAQRGTGYVFGHFMSEADGEVLLDSYRANFQPSEMFREPKVIVAVGVVCADNEEKAAAVYKDGVQAFFGVQASGTANAAHARMPLLGTPDKICRELQLLQTRYGADEMLLVTMTGTYEQRLQSFRLLAEHAIIERSD